MTFLSKQAWEKSKKIIDAIHQHPFNIGLSHGTLAMNKFSYYIEQDTLYLKDYARSLALIAARVPMPFVKDFLSFSEHAIFAEQEIVHAFFKRSLNLKYSKKISPATLSYTSYLLQKASIAPIEVAIASILPCFWVYQDVAQKISKQSKQNNPYQRWIDTYASDSFEKSVQNAIHIFDAMANAASIDLKNKMLDAFYNSTVLEWHFWNDAYHEKIFDLCENGSETACF